MHSGTFWNILQSFWDILHAFWNILHAFWTILELSGTFCDILDGVEGCRKVDFQVDDTHTHRRTYIRNVELRLCS